MRLNSNEEEQISLFPSEKQQIEAIREAESAEAPSAHSVSEGDIDILLRQGTGVQGGKLRIYERYQKGISKREAIKLLKSECGDSERSYTFLDGTEGYAGFRPAKGFIFWWTPGGEKITVSWTKVEKRLRRLIQEGSYLTPEELESYQSIHQERPQAVNDITDMDIDKLLVEDFGAEDRKQRIFALFQQGPSDQQIAEHLRAEYNKHGFTAEERAHEGPCVLADGGMRYGYFVAAEWRLRRRDADGPMRYIKYEEMARNIRTLIDQGRYLTPEEITQITPAPKPDTLEPKPAAAPQEITQADIDAALQEWNGDAASKRRVEKYMADHAREKDTAAWLRREYGDDLPAFPVNGEHTGTDLSWTKVQRHLARLMIEDRFFTEGELANFDDIDTASVREQLQQNRPSAFVEQVRADAERLVEGENPAPSVRESYEHYKPIVKERVLADQAYQNACINSDREAALMEGHMAVERAARSFVDAEDMPFVRLYFDMAEFRSRLHREIIDETYPILSQARQEQSAEKTYTVDTVPTIFCEWSESPVFEDGKTYSVSEFDRLMKQADDEFAAGKKTAMEKYGTWQKWHDAGDAELSRFLGYEKVKFTLIMPDGRTFTERQDIGDGDGGVLDFLSQYDDYREIVPVLRQAVQREQEPPDLSGQPITRDGDTITIGNGEPTHEVDITLSDEEWKTVQKVIGAADQPPRDPLAPAYHPGDTVYLDNTAFEIIGIGLLDVDLRDPTLPIPLTRSESKENFERLLLRDPRNDPIIQYLPAQMWDINDDFREVLTKHLLTDRDKGYISAWIRSGESNRGIAQRLSLAFASRAETVTLETGDTADYFTSTVSMAVEVQDKFGTKLALSWEAVAPILRTLWLQELDGFSHEPVQRESAKLEGKLTYQVGDQVAFAYGDHDISGTIEGIGETDILIHTGPYAWSHQTVNKDFFENALRQDERNAGLFVKDASVEEIPAAAPPAVSEPETPPRPTASHEASGRGEEPEVPAAGNFRITDDNLGVGGARVKYRMNVEAIRTLKQIEMEGRSASPVEQEILSRYVGWGGVPDAFDKNKTDWLHEYEELKELLTPEEYKSAMSSTLNAHYARFVP